MPEHDDNQGTIESNDSRAKLQSRWLLESQHRLDVLLTEARLLDKRGNGVDFDRLLTQLVEADKLFDLGGRTLPRGYSLVKDGRSAKGFYLRKHGTKVVPEQLAIDVAGGLIDEINAAVDGWLAPKRPKLIEAKPDDA